MEKSEVEKEIRNITDQIVRKYKPEKIILFGSHARGDSNPDSDFDFLIIKDDRRVRIERMQAVYCLVEKKVPADFLVYTPKEVQKRLKLGDPFLKAIFEEGKTLYGQ